MPSGREVSPGSLIRFARRPGVVWDQGLESSTLPSFRLVLGTLAGACVLRQFQRGVPCVGTWGADRLSERDVDRTDTLTFRLPARAPTVVVLLGQSSLSENNHERWTQHPFKTYLFMRDRDRDREAETQAEGEAGSMQGARCGTRSQVSRVTPWAEGRC